MTPGSPLRRSERGFGLFDALIALALLSFGLLGMTRFQGRMVSQATESQSRQLATQLAGEQISTVLVDAGNAPCYTLPQQGTCNNAAAAAATAAWKTRAEGALPQPASATAALDNAAAPTRMTLTITWTTKSQSDLSAADAARSLTAITDVRP